MGNIAETLKRYVQERYPQGLNPDALRSRPGMSEAFTPRHSTTWYWPSVNEEGLSLIGDALREAGYNPTQFSFNDYFSGQWPSMIHPPAGHQMPFFRVGEAVINPSYWLDYMAQGAYNQLENELLAGNNAYVVNSPPVVLPNVGTSKPPPAQPTVQPPAQPTAQTTQPSAQATQPPASSPGQPPPEILNMFNQYFGGYTPEQRTQFVPLIESLIRYFGGTV